MKKQRSKIATALVVMILLSIVIPLPAYAREETEAPVTPSGIAYSDIEDTLNRYIADHPDTASSVSLAVFDRNERMVTARSGYAHIQNQTPADENTVYEWGSCSKLLVWVSVMQLYEQGKIDLNAAVQTYLPDGFLTKLTFDTPITMIDLMNHQGGWQETSFGIWSYDAQRLPSLAEALSDVEPPQIFEPGTTTAYSNWGTTLAAYIVERIAGLDYAEYVRQNILAPLDMNHTSVKGDSSDNLWVKEQREQGDYLDVSGAVKDDVAYITLFPAGSATGTLEDFATFAQSFVPAVGEPCALFADDATLDMMLSPTSVYAGTDIARNCHGLWTMAYGVSVMGHGGNTLGFSSQLMFDPQSGLGVAVMTNQCGEADYNYGILPVLFDRCTPQSVTEHPEMSGIYLGKRTIEKGFLSISQYLTLLPVVGPDAEGQYSVMPGTTLTQISDSLFLFDQGNGIESVLNAVQGPEGNTVMLEGYTSDYGAKGSELFFAWGLLLLTAMTWVYVLVRAIICMIGLARCKQVGGAAVMRLLTLVAAFVTVALLVHLWMVGPVFGYDFYYASVVPVCLAVTLLSALPILNIVIMLAQWNVLKKRLRYAMPALLCCVPTVCVIFFQAYDFWSC